MNSPLFDPLGVSDAGSLKGGSPSSPQVGARGLRKKALGESDTGNSPAQPDSPLANWSSSRSVTWAWENSSSSPSGQSTHADRLSIKSQVLKQRRHEIRFASPALPRKSSKGQSVFDRPNTQKVSHRAQKRQRSSDASAPTVPDGVDPRVLAAIAAAQSGPNDGEPVESPTKRTGLDTGPQASSYSQKEKKGPPKSKKPASHQQAKTKGRKKVKARRKGKKKEKALSATAGRAPKKAQVHTPRRNGPRRSTADVDRGARGNVKPKSTRNPLAQSAGSPASRRTTMPAPKSPIFSITSRRFRGKSPKTSDLLFLPGSPGRAQVTPRSPLPSRHLRSPGANGRGQLDSPGYPSPRASRSPSTAHGPSASMLSPSPKEIPNTPSAPQRRGSPGEKPSPEELRQRSIARDLRGKMRGDGKASSPELMKLVKGIRTAQKARHATHGLRHTDSRRDRRQTDLTRQVAQLISAKNREQLRSISPPSSQSPVEADSQEARIEAKVFSEYEERSTVFQEQLLNPRAQQGEKAKIKGSIAEHLDEDNLVQNPSVVVYHNLNKEKKNFPGLDSVVARRRANGAFSYHFRQIKAYQDVESLLQEIDRSIAMLDEAASDLIKYWQRIPADERQHFPELSGLIKDIRESEQATGKLNSEKRAQLSAIVRARTVFAVPDDLVKALAATLATSPDPSKKGILVQGLGWKGERIDELKEKLYDKVIDSL